MPGLTLEELPVADAASIVDEVASVWHLVTETDISAIDGFGDFDPDGRAPARSWREVLETTLEEAHRDLSRKITNRGPDVPRLLSIYEHLIDSCGERRGLTHGDFGSNNVLAERGRVTGVLDWDLAMVGDPLYDVANFYFWASHLPCMQLQADYFARTLSHLDDYDDRVSCYAIRIGLEEARANLGEGDLTMASWALSRSFDFVRT